MSNKPKLLIIGYARHGKDTVAEILTHDYGYKYQSSSQFCAENVVFPVLGPLYNYKTPEECFADRSNHRKEWFDLITDYNQPDRAKLGKDIFNVSNIYCGLRNYDEFMALKEENVFDYSIWVDRSNHLPPEPTTSNTLFPELADITIDNNGSLDDLKKNVFNMKFTIEMEYNQWNLN